MSGEIKVEKSNGMIEREKLSEVNPYFKDAGLNIKRSPTSDTYWLEETGFFGKLSNIGNLDTVSYDTKNSSIKIVLANSSKPKQEKVNALLDELKKKEYKVNLVLNF